jgi:hypothetical protein
MDIGELISDKKLRDVLPREFFIEFANTPAAKHVDRRIICEHDTRVKPWPGTHKNVTYWWVLQGGYAVGLNENPSRGWAFPVYKI